MRCIQQTLGLMLCALLIAGCKKDKDETPPTVRIISPAANSNFAYLDVINVVVEVSDDKNITGLTILVVDQNGVPVLPSRNLSIDQPTFTADQAILIDNIHIVSGGHSILVRASDGTNEGRDAQAINLQEAPLERKAILAICQSSVNTMQVTTIDNSLAQSIIATVNGEFSDATVSSYDQTLWVAGGVSGDLIALDANIGTLLWSQPNLVTNSRPFFTGLHYSLDDHRLYFAQGNGRIRGLAANGIGAFNAIAQLGFLANETMVNSDFVVTDQQQPTGGGNQLVAYNRSSGTEASSFALDKEVVAMYPRGSTHALIFGNRNGQGVISDRNIDQGGEWEPQSFPQGVIQDVVALSSQSFVIALPTGLVRYSYAGNNAITISGINAQALGYDPADDLLLAASGSTLFLLDPNNGIAIGSVQMPYAIEAVMALDNK